jgi:hypothetical protein
MTTNCVTLKLRGPRQLDAADWMLGKPLPEEIPGHDQGTGDWEAVCVTIRDGVLSVPAHLLADFIEECEDGIVMSEHMLDDPYDGADARAFTRAMTTLIEKLRKEAQA